MSLTARELQLAAILLHKAGDKFANHICDDFNLVTEAGMSSQKECKALKVAVSESGGDDEGTQMVRDDYGSHEWTQDWCVMHHIAWRIEEELNGE